MDTVDGRNPAPPGMYKTHVNNGINYHTNWCRISSINSIDNSLVPNTKTVNLIHSAPTNICNHWSPCKEGQIITTPLRGPPPTLCNLHLRYAKTLCFCRFLKWEDFTTYVRICHGRAANSSKARWNCNITFLPSNDFLISLKPAHQPQKCKLQFPGSYRVFYCHHSSHSWTIGSPLHIWLKPQVGTWKEKLPKCYGVPLYLYM